MIIFKYQLLHLGSNKHSIKQSLNLFREEMAEYVAVTDKIKAKSKERKSLLTEKKETPVIHVLKHRDLAKRIAELTEDLEELRSEKAMLLRQLQYPEDATADMFKKQIRTLEDGLKRLKPAKPSMPPSLTTLSNNTPNCKSRRLNLTPSSFTKQDRKFVPITNEMPHGASRMPTAINMICSVCMTVNGVSLIC